MTKKALILSVLFLGLSLFNARSIETLNLPNPAATISMDFKDANLKDILKVFSMQSGLNFVASEAVKDRTITLYLDKVPVLDCMDKLFKANNLSYEKDPDSNIIIVKDWGKPTVQTITKVFTLKYNRLKNSRINTEIENYLDQAYTTSGGTGSTGLTSAVGTGGGTSETEDEEISGDVGLTASIKKILSEYGKITEDVRANALIVTDIPSNFPMIEQTIVALDIPLPQIMLEIEMLDVSKDLVDKIGLKFGQTPFTITLKGSSKDMGFPFRDWNKSGPVGPGWGSVAINNTDATAYSVQFDFLRTATDTKYLARPRILTLSNETAEIKIVTDEAIGVSSTTSNVGGTTTATAERTETGVLLRITPQVNALTGEITMFVMPVVAEASTTTSTFQSGGNANTFKNPEARSTKSVIRVKDGDTVVLGGLIRNNKTQVITKLPFFGDLPVLGTLFRHKSIEPGKERELIVFITPRIVKEGVQQMAEAPKKEASAPNGERQELIGEALKEHEK